MFDPSWHNIPRHNILILLTKNFCHLWYFSLCFSVWCLGCWNHRYWARWITTSDVWFASNEVNKISVDLSQFYPNICSRFVIILYTDWNHRHITRVGFEPTTLQFYSSVLPTRPPRLPGSLEGLSKACGIEMRSFECFVLGVYLHLKSPVVPSSSFWYGFHLDNCCDCFNCIPARILVSACYSSFCFGRTQFWNNPHFIW